ncbi:hypothetical protein WJM97_14455 [Okeanomitos corallinicola TIOX110]|uniref:Uncharacterized protein n=1 Tax=Okeanomitos corallinicola TIOX110 TaxID=3133117 RepID=A0ABZ2UNR2_9CYAN
MYKYLSKLLVFLIAATTSPLFLLPNTAKANCLNYWIHPTTGKKECLGIDNSFPRSNRQIYYDDVEIIDDSASGEKKFRIQPTRCGGYRVRLVDKEDTKSRQLNTYWLGNRSNLSILDSSRRLDSRRMRFYPGYSNRHNRSQRYQNHHPVKRGIQSRFNGNYQRSGVSKFSSCQRYYQPDGNLD